MNQKISRPLIIGAMIASLSACANTERYIREVSPVSIPVRYETSEAVSRIKMQRLEVPAAYSINSVAEDPWWTGYAEERLDRLISRALRVNSNLAAAGFALRRARVEAHQATNDLLPQASGSINGNATRRIDTHDNTEKIYSSTNAIGWEVDLWGRLRAQRDLKAWEATATAEDLQNTAQALVGEICENYWNLAYLNQSVLAGSENISELSRIVELVRVQFQSGNVSVLEVREAEQNLNSERAAQSDLLKQRAAVRSSITVLLDGQSWPQDDEPLDMKTSSSLVIREGLPAELLGRRPDLKASELRLRRTLANIDATARSYYPTLSLTGETSGKSAGLGRALQAPIATFGATINLPFLHISRMKTDTEIAGFDYLKSTEEFRSKLYNALKEVSVALTARTYLISQVEARSLSLEAARDICRIYEIRYRSGAGSLRVWLDARKTLRRSEIALAESRRDQLINDSHLALALGGSGNISSPILKN